MKYTKFVLFTASLFALAGCEKTIDPGKERPLGNDTHTASFMLNYRSKENGLPTGATVDSFNFLYEQKEIELGQKLTAPEVDPIRINYEFKGWFKETACENLWDFDNDVANSSVFLYAKWGQTSGTDYVEPTYTYPETIINDANFRLIGIFGKEITNNEVQIPSGAILRLKNSPADVKFALNYERRGTVSITSSTYDETLSKIHVEVSSGETFDVKVVDNSLALSMASISSTYEQKAANYEKKAANYENYHIMLAGSSSMEYWQTSSEDLAPIVSYNHGIGGTTVEQWTDKLFERLVLPYAPKCVTYYVGVNNIINSGDDGVSCGNKVKALLDKTHAYLPNTKVFYVLINKLPGYANKTEDFNKCHNIVIDYCNNNAFADVIDAGAPLLKPNGNPNAAYFRTDGLHMSLYGYTLWGNEVKKALIDWLG